MVQKNKLYEVTFIVNASLDDAQIDSIIEKVKETISKNGGNVSEVAKWGRKRFAYTIKRKNNGFYVLIEFSAKGNIVHLLERHFHLEENIIRFLIIALDKKSLSSRISAAELTKQLSQLSASGVPAISASVEDIDVDIE